MAAEETLRTKTPVPERNDPPSADQPSISDPERAPDDKQPDAASAEPRALARGFSHPQLLAVIGPLIALALLWPLTTLVVWRGLPPASVEIVPRLFDTDLDPVWSMDRDLTVIQFVSGDLRIYENQLPYLRHIDVKPQEAASIAPSATGFWIGSARAQEQAQTSQPPETWLVAEPVAGLEEGSIERAVFKLGEAIYGGPFEGIPHLVNVILYPPADSTSQQRFLDVDATEELLSGGVKAALLKADALGVSNAFIVAPLHAKPGVVDRENTETIGAIRQLAPSFTSLRRVYVIAQEESAGVSSAGIESTQHQIQALTRILFTRLPPAAVESLATAPADPDAIERMFGSASNPVGSSVIADTRELSSRSSLVPLLLGFLAYCAVLVQVGFRAARKGWRFVPWRRPQPALYFSIALMPAAILAFNGLTWSSFGAGWTPDPTQVSNINAFPLLVYGLPVLAGLMAGGGVLRWAFDKSPPQADEGSSRQSLRSILIRDTPVTGGAAADRLGFAQLVLALARFVDNRETEPPVVLAITGPWGSGKSSVMRMLQGELEPTGRFRFAWFNAWEHQERDQILAAFLRTIGRQLRNQHGARLAFQIAWIRLREASYWDLLMQLWPLLLVGVSYLLWNYASERETAASGLFGVLDEDGDPIELLSVAAASISGLGGLAGLLSLARWLKPFQVPLAWLFARPNAGMTEASYLDQFRSEFALYRQAVHENKFVIFIDDLDRCPPESVVEVLKAVNLIITSDEGPGKTFFILGFDWGYVTSSIELSFEKFIEANPELKGQFGGDYLKKIVTLPISVPEPAAPRITTYVNELDARRPTAPAEHRASGWRDARERINPVLISPLAQFVVTLVVLLAGFWLLLAQMPQGTGTTQPAEPKLVEPPGIINTPTPPGTIITVDLPEVAPPQAWPNWLQWLALVTAAGLATAAVTRLRRVSDRPPIPPEPVDPPEFLEAVRQVSASMPRNPRDVIRLLNQMRVTYFLQQPMAAGEDIYTPPLLTPEESVALSLLHYRNPVLFDRERLSAAATAGGLGDNGGAWATAVRQALTQAPAAQSVFDSASGISRFLEIYRNLLPSRPPAASDEIVQPRP